MPPVRVCDALSVRGTELKTVRPRAALDLVRRNVLCGQRAINSALLAFVRALVLR
jgi:hypothetical protein